MLTIWLAYVIAALIASAVFVAAGWRSRAIAGSGAHIHVRNPDLVAPDRHRPAPSASVEDARAAIDLALKRLGSTIIEQGVRVEVAAEPGLLVRTRAATLQDMIADLLAVGIHAVPGGRFLLTASQHAGRVEVSLSDDAPITDADLRRSQTRALAQRVALAGGSLDVMGRPGYGTSMTLRLAGAVTRAAAPALGTTAEAWPEELPQLL